MPTVKVRGKKIKLPYNKKGKAMAAKLKKKKKSRGGEDYGQIPTNNGTENPVGGN
tara:strand:+ start:39 stop:203 length:165 start_codon:yes stop_codon:yes gene_type:complete